MAEIGAALQMNVFIIVHNNELELSLNEAEKLRDELNVILNEAEKISP